MQLLVETGIPVRRRIALWCEDVGAVLASVVAYDAKLGTRNHGRHILTLTRTLVVADGEVWRDTSADVGETVGAVLGVASDVGGVLPHDLAEVTPLLEVGHVGAVLAVQA